MHAVEVLSNRSACWAKARNQLSSCRRCTNMEHGNPINPSTIPRRAGLARNSSVLPPRNGGKQTSGQIGVLLSRRNAACALVKTGPAQVGQFQASKEDASRALELYPNWGRPALRHFRASSAVGSTAGLGAELASPT